MDHDSPEYLGPIAWAKLFGHGVTGIGVCEILSPDCTCRADCEDLGSAMHDLVNFELGKHIHHPVILRKVAGRYQKAADGGCPGGVCN